MREEMSKRIWKLLKPGGLKLNLIERRDERKRANGTCKADPTNHITGGKSITKNSNLNSKLNSNAN